MLDKKESAWMDDIDRATQCLIWLSGSRLPQESKVRNYYVIAEKDLVPELPHSSEWPKLIGYCYADDYFLFLKARDMDWVDLLSQLTRPIMLNG